MNTVYLPFKAEIIRKGRLKLLGVWTLQQFVLIKGGLVGPAKSYALLYRSLECDKKQHGFHDQTLNHEASRPHLPFEHTPEDQKRMEEENRRRAED